MTITVFTCTVGPTPDVVREPATVNKAVRYVCLSDRPASPWPYVHVPVTVPAYGPRSAELYARKLKILANHPALEAPDVILWHDAAFQLRCDPVQLADAYLGRFDVLAFRHPHRARIEDEAVAIAKLAYAPLATLQQQAASYRAAGFLADSVITSTGFSLRRMTPAMAAFNAAWWAEVKRWTWRDQMSVDYALWRSGLRVGYVPGHYRDNPFAFWFATPTARPSLVPNGRRRAPFVWPTRPVGGEA